MICPKCNTKLENNSKYCPKCGEVFKSNDVELYSSLFNAKLLEIYYPNKDIRVKIWGISLLYALFSFFYAVYKRMYRVAIISIIVLYIPMFLIPRFMNYVFNSYGFSFYPLFFLIVACLGIYVYYIFSFDRLLLERRKNKINYIIRTNYGESEKFIENLVIKDSKNNIKGLVIMIIITLIFVLYKLFIS